MIAAVFTDAEKTDIRRFMGYAPYGTDANTVLFGSLVNQPGVIEARLNRLSEEEGTIVTRYLKQLRELELAILGAASNLEDDVLGPLKRNKSEISERTALYDEWRRRLCQFFNFPPGPGLRTGGLHWVV